MASNANLEASYARNQADESLRMGRLQSKLIQDSASQEGKQLKTSQAEFNAATRAQMAAMGITGVTADDITTSNLSKQQLDELALRFNADSRSWEATTQAGYNADAQKYSGWQSDIQADQYRYAGKAAKHAGKTQAFTTLLSTASSIASMGSGAPKTSFSTGSSSSFSNTAPFKPANLSKLR